MVQSSLQETVHSREFLQKIQRSLGSSTIALFVLLDDHGKERLEPAGNWDSSRHRQSLLHFDCRTRLGAARVRPEIRNLANREQGPQDVD